MNFASPNWLWQLVWIPFFVLLVVFHERGKAKRLAQFAKKPVWNFIIPERVKGVKLKKSFCLIAALAFFIVALSRPQWGSHDETVQTAGLDIMVVLDVSASMNVEDVVPSRLKSAKHLIRSLVEHLEGDRVGMVAFAGNAYVACPLTTDLSYLLQSVQIVSSKTIQSQGTDIQAGVDAALKALERGAQEESNLNLANGAIPSHVLILISDGEDHDGSAAQALAQAKSQGVRVYVLGVGSEKGGPIPIRDAAGNLQTYKKDAKGQPIVSQFSPDSLSRLAKEANGKYWSITPGENEVHELVEDLGGLTRGEHGRRQFRVYEDRFQIPLLLGILCLLGELFLSASRRRVMMGLISLISTFYLQAFSAHADGKPSTPLESYLENKKGLEAFKAGKIDEAEKSFGAAQARDPKRAELQFNQGVVQYEGGDYDRAIEAFQGAARSSGEQRETHLHGKSLYNLGNAQTKKGNIKDAVRSYLGAIQSAQDVKDEALENEARKNLELLLSQAKQEKQKQKQDQSEKDKQKQDQKEKSDQGSKDNKKQDSSTQDSGDKNSKPEKQDPSESKSEENKKDQDSQNQDKKKPEEKKSSDAPEESKKEDQPSEQKDSKENEDASGKEDQKKGKQSFRSQKMKPEDADRVMAELSNRERELQEKLQTQNLKPQPHRKDW